jgi:hypothetical protein
MPMASHATRIGSRSSPTKQSTAARLSVGARAFFDEVLERSVVGGEFSDHGFIVRELLLELFHPFELRHFFANQAIYRCSLIGWR